MKHTNHTHTQNNQIHEIDVDDYRADRFLSNGAYIFEMLKAVNAVLDMTDGVLTVNGTAVDVTSDNQLTPLEIETLIKLGKGAPRFSGRIAGADDIADIAVAVTGEINKLMVHTMKYRMRGESKDRLEIASGALNIKGKYRG